MATTLTSLLKQQARQLGFSLVGVCPAVAPPGLPQFRVWLQNGYAGEMSYLPNRAGAYAHPQSVLEGVRSVVMLGMDYRTAQPKSAGPGHGRVSRYAWGTDYHDVIRCKLQNLSAWVVQQHPTALVRGVIDTAPLLERDFAQLAGLGWIGKNTLLLNKQHGSWFFLAALLTDLELDYDAPHETDHCGTCRACLDACPTGAFVDAYVLDARKCISYLTIELRTMVPQELRSGLGDWVFGCDVCQDVCPWNHKSPQSEEIAFQPADEMNPLDLISLFDLDDEAFRKRFRHTPLWRAKRRGLLRNAAIVLGNQCHVAAVPALTRGLDDDEPLVRAACAWALGQLGKPCIQALQQRQCVEEDASVRAEIEAALTGKQSVALELHPPT